MKTKPWFKPTILVYFLHFMSNEQIAIIQQYDNDSFQLINILGLLHAEKIPPKRDFFQKKTIFGSHFGSIFLNRP